MTDINNLQDIIDSRDVIERIEELEADIDLYADEPEHDLTDEKEELRVLKALQEDAEGYAPDWHHGSALIRESHFTEYAEQLADDIGSIDSNAGWPNNHIDWEAAAEELKIDYTEVDFDGVTYLIR